MVRGQVKVRKYPDWKCAPSGTKKRQKHTNNDNSNYNFYYLSNGYCVPAIVTACFIFRHYKIDLIVPITDGILELQEVKEFA